MKIATWNVNSVRSRLERLMLFLDRHQPDVVCLQELKCQDKDFPADTIAELGYQAAVFGQKTYNGVAILSRLPMSDVRTGLGDDVDDPQARLVSAEIAGLRVINVYIPNGSDMASEKYPYKLQWLARLRKMLETSYSPDQPLIICGDTNVLLHDDDAAHPDVWAQTGIGCDEVRQAMNDVLSWGLHDIFRLHNPEGGIFTWWDYRRLGFQQNNGMRIDHIFATKTQLDKCSAIAVDRNERKGTKPSDHAPVIATFD